MKFKTIKKMVNEMSKEQLNQTVIFCVPEDENFGDAVLKKAKQNLYSSNDGYDRLYTKTELKHLIGLSEQDIYDDDIVVKRGEYFITS